MTFAVTSNARLFVALSVVTLILLIVAGTIFGWPSLTAVFTRERLFFDELCAASALGATQAPAVLCDEALVRLALPFTLGTAAMLQSMMLNGIAVDRFGSRVASIYGACLFAVGSAFFAAHKVINTHAALNIGAVVMCIGGPAIYLAAFSLRSLWPSRPSTVIALFSTAFDASTVTFLVFDLIHEARPEFSSEFFFVGLVIIGVLVAIGAVFLWPERPATVTAAPAAAPESDAKPPLVAATTSSRRHSKRRRSTHKKPEELLKRTSSRRKSRRRATPALTAVASLRHPATAKEDEYVFEDGVVVFALSRQPALVQLRSGIFWQLVAFSAIAIVFSNFYIGSQELRLAQMTGGDDGAEETTFLLRIFGFMLPTSFVWAPLVGPLLDKRGIITTLVVVQISSIVRVVCQLVPVPRLQIFGFVVFAFWRAAFFSVLVAAIVRIFGGKTFGTLYGTLSLICGLFNFLIYAFTVGVTDLQSFLFIDVIELVLSVLSIAFPIALARQSASLWLKKA
jgi:hypothetical protein